MYVMLFNLYLLRLGYDLAFIGLVNGVAQMGMALFSLPAGSMGRRWTSRRMLIVGIGMAAIGLGALPLAESMPAAWQAGWLIGTYAFAWLGGALFIVNSNPFLMSVTGPEERQHVFSIRQAVLPLAAFGGSLVGGLLPGLLAGPLGLTLDQPDPYRYVLFIAAAFLIPALLALKATRSVISSDAQQIRVEDAGPRPTGLMAFMALVVLLQVVGHSSARTFFNVYLDDGLHMSTAAIGGLAAVGQLLAAPVALVTPFLVARWGSGRTITWGILGMALALLPLALIPHWSAAGSGFMGVVALFALTTPAFAVCQQEIVAPAWRATMAGAIAMTTGLSTAAVAFGGGYVIDAFGYQTFFVACAVLAAVGSLLFWGFTWVPRLVILHQITAGKLVRQLPVGALRSIIGL